jgi:hypothetical protein
VKLNFHRVGTFDDVFLDAAEPRPRWMLYRHPESGAWHVAYYPAGNERIECGQVSLSIDYRTQDLTLDVRQPQRSIDEAWEVEK